MILAPSHNSFQNNSLHHDCHNPHPFLDHLHRPLVADPPERQATNLPWPSLFSILRTWLQSLRTHRQEHRYANANRVRWCQKSPSRSYEPTSLLFSAISCHSSRVSEFLQTSRSMLVCWYGVPNWGKIGLFLGVLATTVGGLFSFRTRLPILIHTSRICHLCDFHCVCMVVLDNVVWYHGIRVIIGIIKTFSDRSYR